MILLDFVLILIGLVAVIISFLKIEDTVQGGMQDAPAVMTEESGLWLEEEVKEKVASLLQEEQSNVVEESKEQLGHLSNEKILAVGEYGDQVLDKIQKNHSEVVFLYNMLNEKENEIKEVVHNLDKKKAELTDFAAKTSYDLKKSMKEEQKKEEERRREVEYRQKEIKKRQDEKRRQAAPKQPEDTKETPVAAAKPVLEEEPPVKEKSKGKLSVMDLMEITREKQEHSLEEEEKLPVKTKETAPQAGIELAKRAAASAASRKESTQPSEQRVTDRPVEHENKPSYEDKQAETKSKNEMQYFHLPDDEAHEPIKQNLNDVIIEMHKEGRSILEISKDLELGQGEVKFVIDLYGNA